MHWLSESQSSLGDACYRGAKLLSLVGYYTTAAALAQAMPEVFDGNETVINRGEGTVNPSSLIVVNQDQDRLIVATTGVQTQDHALHLADGWLQPIPDGQAFPNPYYADAQALLSLIPRPASQWRQIVMVGHSWGGAISRSLQFLITRRDYHVEAGRSLYTYGSPKYDLDQYWDIDSGYIQRRIVAPLDVVPNSPPSLRGLGAITLGLSNILARRLEQQTTGPGGLTFDSNGNFVGTSVLPEGPLADYTITTLGGLLLQPHYFANAVHEIGNYINLLLGHRMQNPVPADIPSPPVRPPRQVPLEAIEQERQDAFRENSQIAESQPQKIAQWANQIVTPVPGVKFRVGKRNRKRGVFFGKTLICSVRSRRSATAVKNMLNAQLRLATFNTLG